MNEPDLRCYHHPERPATDQCDRYGDYLCTDCASEHDGQHVCRRCHRDLQHHILPVWACVLCIAAFLAGFAWLPLLSEWWARGPYPDLRWYVTAASSVVAICAAVGVCFESSTCKLALYAIILSAIGAAQLWIFECSVVMLSGIRLQIECRFYADGWKSSVAVLAVIALAVSLVLWEVVLYRGIRPLWAAACGMACCAIVGIYICLSPLWCQWGGR